MTRKASDRIITLFWLAAATGICWGSIQFSLGDFHRPGPGFFSFLAGTLLGTLSFIVFLQSFRKQPGEQGKPFWSNRKRGLKMVYVIIALILFTIGLKFLGYILGTFLFIGFLMRGIEPQKWPVVLMSSSLGALISYGIFKCWLDLPLPTGILGF